MAAEPDGDTARMTRRIERERQARLQAERIAEESIRSGWERQREIELLGLVAVTANEATGILGPVTAGLPYIARYVGWPAAFAWLVDPDSGSLEPVADWQADSDGAGYPPGRAVWREHPLSAGEGLPGRAAQGATPVWGEDLLPGPDGKVSCALAVPLRAGPEVVGVVAFAHRVPTALPDDLVHLIEQLCGQIALAVDRARTLDELQRIRRELDDRVARRTAELAQARQDAEAANKAKESLLVTLAHEVRTPIHGIMGMIELIMLEEPGPPLDEYARAVDDAARNLLAMFNVLVELVEKNLDPDLIRERLEGGLSDA